MRKLALALLLIATPAFGQQVDAQRQADIINALVAQRGDADNRALLCQADAAAKQRELEKKIAELEKKEGK